jgi:hypothetical protein
MNGRAEDLKIVLATYSLPRVLGAMAIVVPIVIAGFAYAVYAPPSPTYGLLFHATLLMCSALLVPLVGILLYQLVFDGRSAVWIENDKIVHVHGWYRVVDASDVIEVSVGYYGRSNRPGVVLKLRDGRNTSIQADLASEPIEMVAERLRKFLAAT